MGLLLDTKHDKRECPKGVKEPTAAWTKPSNREPRGPKPVCSISLDAEASEAFGKYLYRSNIP